MNKKLIVFDFNRTLYNPDKEELIDGAMDVLDKLLASNAKMILISRKEDGRENTVRDMRLERFFYEVFFVKEKTVDFFESISREYGNEKIYVVGDYMHEEIRYGNIAGMETIWFKNGKFSDMEPRDEMDRPKYIVNHISEIIQIIFQTVSFSKESQKYICN